MVVVGLGMCGLSGSDLSTIMKHRIRATFNPPPQYLTNCVLPEQVERQCDGLADLSEQLRELVYAGNKLLSLKARLVIEITPLTPEQTTDAP